MTIKVCISTLSARRFFIFCRQRHTKKRMRAQPHRRARHKLYYVLNEKSVVVFSSEYLSEALFDFSAQRHRLDGSAYSLDMHLESSVLALGILLMSIHQHAGNEIADLLGFKVFRLGLGPSEDLGILVMEHIPEFLLGIVPKKIVDLVATDGGEIQEGLR